ncbi:SUMO1 [Symbiodinium sp. CCMP2592]|nr:SUMO1 [Symbiodinium sp. CCMP2592]
MALAACQRQTPMLVDGATLVQLLPQGWESQALGPERDGRFWRHCYWLQKSAPWQKLVFAWAEDHRLLASGLCLRDSEGRDVPLDQTPDMYVSGPDSGPTEMVVVLKEGAASEEVDRWEAAAKQQCEPTAPPDGAQRVRITAWRDDRENASSSLTFCVQPDMSLRGLMVDWCSRQGLSLADVSFKAEACPGEITAADTLRSLAPEEDLPRAEIFEIRADPRSDRPAKAQSLQLPDLYLPSASTKPQQSAVPAEDSTSKQSSASKSAAPRVQVRIAAHGILSERLKPSSEQAGLSFWTKMLAPIGKVIAAWCRHHNLTADSIFVSYNGKPLQAGDTPATHGWSPNTEVILEALHVSDPRVMQVMEQQRQPPQPPQQLQPPQPPQPQPSVKPAAKPVESDRPGGRALLKVYDEVECFEFWMRPTTTFERMMKAWREQRKLEPAQNVRFQLMEGEGLRAGDLSADETPAVRGWLKGMGVIMVRAWAHEADAAETPVDPNRSMSVKVEADSPNGVNEVKFNMRLSAPLGKMMKAWCGHHGLPLEKATFMFQQRVLMPEDTLQSLGCVSGEVVFRAVPSEAKARVEAKEAGKTEAKEPSDQQKVSVKVEAEGADGLNELRFNMRLSTPLAKMMQAWCDHNQVPMEDAAFLLGAVVLKPEDTLHGLGCRDEEEVVVRAVPREEEEGKGEAKTAAKTPHEAEGRRDAEESKETEAQVPREESEEVGKTEAKARQRFHRFVLLRPFALQEPSDQQRASVYATGEDDAGLRQGAAWCGHNQVPMEDAAFLLGTVVLKPEDTLHGLGCRDEAEVVVRAVPREEEEGKGEAKTAAKTPHEAEGRRDAEESKETEAQVPREESEEVGKTEAKEPSDQRKVSVKVEAEGADGLNELRFNMRLSTPLAKMMQAWCGHNQVPMEDAAFLLGTVVLKPEDTLHGLGCRDEAEVVVRAVPREEEEGKGEAKTAAKTPHEAEGRRDAEESKETEAQVPREESEEVGKTEAKARQRFHRFVLLRPFALQEPSDQQRAQISRHRLEQRKVSVKVEAEGADGLNELRFNMPIWRLSTPLAKMMQAWCGHNQVPMEDAAFLLGTVVLKPEDTLHGLGCRDEAEVVVRAVPREEEEGKGEAKTAAKTPHEAEGRRDAEESKETEAQVPREESEEVGKTEAKEPSDQRKVSVKVEAEGADGLNELRFNMRLSTPLAKMMQAWCGHNQVPMEDAAFLLGTVVLKPEETAAERQS